MRGRTAPASPGLASSAAASAAAFPALVSAAALAWIAGVALQLQQPALWPMPLNAGLLGAGLLLVVLGWWQRARWPRVALAMISIALAACAFGSTAWRAEARLADSLPPALEGQDLVLTGVVARLPQSNLSGTRFVFDVDSASQLGRAVRVPERLALGWYRGFDADAMLAGPAADLRAGQRWRFTVRLRQPHGSINPHGFDLELWLFEQGIRASGYVRATASTPPEKLDEDAGHPVERLRQRLRDAIELRVANATAAGVLAALAVGDQAAIERSDWDLFRITGVAHLMSISGLHVTMFAWLAGAAIGALWRLNARAMLWLPSPMAARWGGLAAAAAYAVLAGWGVPAQRTVWMIASVVLLQTLGLRWPQPLVLLAAALVVTALDPWALLQPGFWLSFVAVGLLIASEPVRALAPGKPLPVPTQPPDGLPEPPPGRGERLRGALIAGLRTQMVATVGLAPLTLVFFQQISLVGFVANLVAIPLVTLIVTPLALLGVLLPPLWALASLVVQGLMWGLDGLAQAPLAVWTTAAAPAWAGAAGLLGAALLVMPLPWRLRWLGLPLLLPLLSPAVPRPPPGQFEMVAVDIGQGTAVLLRTHRHLLVYDSGPMYSPEADAGDRVLLPLLRARGERQIDLLMLTHRDTDHVGGAAALLARGGVRAVSSSLSPGHPLRAGPLPHGRCDAGQAWDWDGVHFEVLHPRAEDHAETAKPNSLSCVLRVSTPARSVLLTGDIEAAQEAALLARGAAALKSDVLLVPHHGSRTSSTPAFLDAVAPNVAVVQAGYRSRYGHPAPDVMARYRERGIKVQRSDDCGAWTLAPGGGTSCERHVGRRYWHHPGTVGASGTSPNPVLIP